MALHRSGDGDVVAARVVLGKEVTGEHLHEVQVHVRLHAWVQQVAGVGLVPGEERG